MLAFLFSFTVDLTFWASWLRKKSLFLQQVNYSGYGNFSLHASYQRWWMCPAVVSLEQELVSLGLTWGPGPWAGQGLPQGWAGQAGLVWPQGTDSVMQKVESVCLNPNFPSGGDVGLSLSPLSSHWLQGRTSDIWDIWLTVKTDWNQLD